MKRAAPAVSRTARALLTEPERAMTQLVAALGAHGSRDSPRHRSGILAVDEDPLPDLEVREQPQPVAVLRRARAMLVREPAHRARPKEPAPLDALARDQVV